MGISTMKISDISRMGQNAGRLRDIVTILGKYGLADWLKDLDYNWLQSRLISARGQRLGDISREARIRLALTELGTTFIKLGQILSTRADLVGRELAKELQQLQANTPPDPPEVVAGIIEAELGKKPGELFAEYEAEAMASASIGQVHRARLAGGEQVIVKVQHKGIQKTIARDFDILEALAELAEKHAQQLQSYQPVAMVAEMRRSLMRELDFTRERRNMQQFTANFVDNERIHFPRTYPDLSSSKVLVMERLDGFPLSDQQRLAASGTDLSEFSHLGATMYLDMIFRDGFYHADPHPGNLFMLADGVLGVLDSGMVGRIDEQLRDDFEAMLLSAVNNDADQLTEFVIRLGSVPQNFDRDALRAEIGDFLAEYAGQSLKEFDVGGALERMTEIIRGYNIILPSSVALLLRVLIMLEGTSRLLNPDFSLAELLKPYYAQALKRRLSPKRLLRRSQRAFRDWERLIDMFPREIADLLERIRRGSFEVNLHHRRLDAIVNRLVLGVLTAALFMGSAMLWSRAAPPLVLGISLFGALGCFSAIILGLRLLWAIQKSGKIESDE
jgi:ubiquinone biosynthesis protein